MSITDYNMPAHEAARFLERHLGCGRSWELWLAEDRRPRSQCFIAFKRDTNGRALYSQFDLQRFVERVKANGGRVRRQRRIAA